MNYLRLQSSALIICVALTGIVQADGDGLGQLFTSASERARIDSLRANTQPQQEVPTSTPAARIVVNGTLQGSDGKRLVWLNGNAVNPSNSSDMTLLGDGRVELSWREGKRTLKPGQGIDQSSGEVFEHYTPVPVPAPVAIVNEPEATANPNITEASPEATANEVVDSKSAAPDPKAKPK